MKNDLEYVIDDLESPNEIAEYMNNYFHKVGIKLSKKMKLCTNFSTIYFYRSSKSTIENFKVQAEGDNINNHSRYC